MSLSFSPSAPKETLILSTGLGLSDRGVPLRLPALMLPGLSLLRETLARGQKARYIIYQATDFIIEANKLCAPKAQQNAARTKGYLHFFIHHFFPDLAPSISLKLGAECPVEPNLLEKVETTLHDLELTTSSMNTTNGNDVADAFALLRAYGTRHKGGNGFMRYAAANVLLNAGFAETCPLIDLRAAAPTIVMPLGGKREAPFFTLTSAVAAHTGCAHRLAPKIVPTGSMPAYYPCPDGDLLLDEANPSFVPPRRIKGDFEALRTIGASIPVLRELSTRPSTPYQTTTKMEATP